MAYTKYSLTPADNNAAPPNGAPEGMLPSAVNDTMRDMMSQVRDVGDGIRGGTYTMTAPVITGGSITGVALSGNTLTNPVITGGSINNTPIGASTANTGNFTTLGASSTATLNTLVSSGATITGGTISGVSLSATSPNFTTPVLGTPTSGTLTNCTGLPVATGVSGLGSNVATFLATPSSANLASAVSDETGSGALVFATSPALTTPNLGTPSAATLTNATGLPVGTGISGLGTGVATFLATPSSANLRTAVTDETGSGALVFATSPTLVTPVLGVATATSVQGIIGNVTPAAGTFTTLTANGNTTLGDAAGDITTVPDLKALQVTSADRHSVRPSLLLDFANTKTLDPRITFTRASTGTFYDGRTVAKAEENLLLQSQTFTNASWTKGAGAILTANSTVAPDGTTTATLFDESATSNYKGCWQFITGAVGTFAGSVFVKAGTGSARFVRVAIVDSAGTSFGYVTVALADGSITQAAAVTGSATSASATVNTLANGWYRINLITTMTVVANSLFIIPSDTGTPPLASLDYGRYVYTGNGSTFSVWGAQLEQRSSVTAYTATTTAPITNYIPALQSAASGVARFEHNPVTGESLGLEIEEQRTNLLTYSEDWSNAAWTKTEVTITANTIISPDGALTGDKLVESTATDFHDARQTFSATSGTAYTFSVYAKAGERNRVLMLLAGGFSSGPSVDFNLTTGAIAVSPSGNSSSATITAVGNGWYRCTLTATASSTASSTSRIYTLDATGTASYTGNGFSGIYIWGAQVEAGAFATSYIPTTTAQVTRSADAASMTGTNFSSWYRADEGTVYQDLRPIALSGNYSPFWINTNTTNGIGSFLTTASHLFVINGNATQANIDAGTVTASTDNKIGFVYKTNDFAAVINGGTVGTDTSGTLPVVNRVDIGTYGSNTMNSTIKKLAYYPKRLTNAELQGLTTV